MTGSLLGVSMLALIVIAIMLGFPTAFTLMGLGFIYGFLYFLGAGSAPLDNPVFP